jgi:hypothetical protein
LSGISLAAHFLHGQKGLENGLKKIRSDSNGHLLGGFWAEEMNFQIAPWIV